MLGSCKLITKLHRRARSSRLQVLRNHPPRWHLIALSVAVLILPCCGDDSGDRPVNVVLLTLDTTRADALRQCGGNGSAPVLDSLAEQSILYTNARATAPITAPSHASLLTGLHPFAHGIRNNDLYRLDTTAMPLARILQQHGYRTEAIIAASVLRRSIGLDLGFEHYDDPRRVQGRTILEDAERPANEITDRAIERLESFGSEPFFLWVHYFDPHKPYKAIGPLDPPVTARKKYWSEVRFMDREIGRLFDAMRDRGLFEDALIVVAGDHGEGLGDQQELAHSFLLEEETVGIPLLVRLPGSSAVGITDVPASGTDVFSTVLGVMGLEQPYPVHGIDLVAAFRANGTDLAGIKDRPIYAETHAGYHLFRWAKLQSVVQGDWKYVQNVEDELFSLARPRSEGDDLAARNPQQVERLKQELRKILDVPVPRFSSDAELDAEESARLQELGYMARSDTESADEPVDPREHYQSCVDYFNARRLAGLDRPDEARAILIRLTAEYPRVPGFREYLGLIEFEAGDYASAASHFEIVVGLQPSSIKSRFLLGFCQAKLDRPQLAREQYEKTLSLFPGYLEAHLQLRHVLRQLRDFTGVLRECILIVQQCSEVDTDDARSIIRETIDSWLPATIGNARKFGQWELASAEAFALLDALDAPELEPFRAALAK